jgi:hypothetical protein
VCLFGPFTGLGGLVCLEPDVAIRTSVTPTSVIQNALVDRAAVVDPNAVVDLNAEVVQNAAVDPDAAIQIVTGAALSEAVRGEVLV